MGTKDITEKHLEDLNDVFADIVNVLLFNGERLVKEKDLEADTNKTMFKADGQIHEQERDVSKFWKNGEIRISILGLENQTVQDADMPLRVIGYDGASYKQQYQDKKNKKRYPVVTLVLYFGTDKKWSTNKTLYDCFENVPEKLLPFVNNYKINVFNIAWLSEEQISMFKSDFKFIAQFLRTQRLNLEYTGSKEKLQHANETLKLFTALMGDDSFEKVYNERNSRKGGFYMCNVVEQILNKGREEGRIEAAINLLKMHVGTVEQIAQAQGLPLEKVLELQKEITVKA